MVDAETAKSIESAAAMVEQLVKAFTDLESHRNASGTNRILWGEIKEYFDSCEASLKKRLSELEEKAEAFEGKKSSAAALIAEKKAAITAKEQALLDPLQELKDAAVDAIQEARKKYGVNIPQPADPVGSIKNEVSIPINDNPSGQVSAPEESKPGASMDGLVAEINPRPQLKQLCEQMDSKGLLNVLSENWKNLATLGEEVQIALKCASDPAQLVLDSLKSFYPPEHISSLGNVKDTALQSTRRTCIFLMESSAPLLGMGEPCEDHLVSSDVKQQAKAIADEWKAKLASAEIVATNGISLEAQAFLQLLATFSIASEFHEDELCKFVLAISRHRQTPELCRSLGLTHKMPGVIEMLINTGKQIDAVHFAHAFQLFESFPPVPLLKAYMKDLRRNGQGKDANTQELGALRAVIKCVEEYNLQSEYPLDPLQKRIIQLEKAKANKKRMGEAPKEPPKKPRTFKGYAPQRPAVAAGQRATAVGYDDRRYYGGSARYPSSIPAPVTASVPAPAAAGYDYQMPTHGLYASTAQQAVAPRQYYYPEQPISSASYGSGAGGSAGYGAYTASGLPSSNQPYM